MEVRRRAHGLEQRLHEALKPLQNGVEVRSCEASLGHSLCRFRHQSTIVFREDQGAITTVERILGCQRLCILAGDKILLVILKENDIKMKCVFK